MARPTDPSGRRVGKSAAAFRTISEVAQDLGVPQHVLRFWETKFSQVRPLKRGGGRRYYRPEDVALLRRIRGLLYDEGYTIKGVQRLLREGGAKVDKAAPTPATPSAAVPADTQPTPPPTAAPPSADAVPVTPQATPAPAQPTGLTPSQRDTLRGLQSELTDLKSLLDKISD